MSTCELGFRLSCSENSWNNPKQINRLQNTTSVAKAYLSEVEKRFRDGRAADGAGRSMGFRGGFPGGGGAGLELQYTQPQALGGGWSDHAESRCSATNEER